MPMKVKLKVLEVDAFEHVHVEWWVDHGDGWRIVGKLELEVGEYQAIGSSLGLGARSNRDWIQVIHEDGVFKTWAKGNA